MNKAARERVKAKYGGRCAYCGIVLGDRWQVDHIYPVYRGGKDAENNYNPACCVCNLWKRTFTLDEFRREVAAQAERAQQYSGNFRMARRYGLVEVVNKPVVFFFEEGGV